MERPLFAKKGPKKSMPTLVNGGSFGVILSADKSAIHYCDTLLLLRLQTTHLFITFLAAALALIISKTSARVWTTYNFCLHVLLAHVCPAGLVKAHCDPFAGLWVF